MLELRDYLQELLATGAAQFRVGVAAKASCHRGVGVAN